MYHTNFVEQNLVLEVVRVMSFGIKLDLFAGRLSLSIGSLLTLVIGCWKVRVCAVVRKKSLPLY